MHPGPVNRGVELSAEVIDSPQALITEQVESGVVVRMAVLYELLAGRGAPSGDRGALETEPSRRESTPAPNGGRPAVEARPGGLPRPPPCCCAAPGCSTRAPGSTEPPTS